MDMIIGEAWGAEEEQNFRKIGMPCPFIGEAGKELDRWLIFAGFKKMDGEHVVVDRSGFFISNVFNCRPPHNDVGYFFAKPVAVKSGMVLSVKHPVPYKSHGVLKAEFDCELDRLHAEIASVNPAKILALGATALWALLGKSTITQYRGVWCHTQPGSVAVLPTYHPAYVLRKYSTKVFAVHDVLKFARGYSRPAERNIYVAESLEDCEFFCRSFVLPTSTLAIDIETKSEITMISVAPSGDKSLVIDLRRLPDTIGWLSWLLHQPHEKVMQNATYDLTWLASYGIKPAGVIHDTMLLSHSLQPELPKDLGTLASLHLDEHAWKPLGRSLKSDE